VELEIKKPKANGASTKLPNQKPCEKMAEAIVMDGGKRGQVVKVCADPACWIRLISDPLPAVTSSYGAAKRYRVDTEKLQKAGAKEFVAKRDNKTIKPKPRKTTA
jgi:hypothetical protein